MDLLTALTAWGQVGQVYTKPAKISFSTIFLFTIYSWHRRGECTLTPFSAHSVMVLQTHFDSSSLIQ